MFNQNVVIPSLPLCWEFVFFPRLQFRSNHPRNTAQLAKQRTTNTAASRGLHYKSRHSTRERQTISLSLPKWCCDVGPFILFLKSPLAPSNNSLKTQQFCAMFSASTRIWLVFFCPSSGVWFFLRYLQFNLDVFHCGRHGNDVSTSRQSSAPASHPSNPRRSDISGSAPVRHLVENELVCIQTQLMFV